MNERPNILLCLADDASFPNMSAYGCSWVQTPGFDRVAREGLLCNRGYTPNAKCAPSRAALLTGRNSWQLKAAANHWCAFPAEFQTITETLEKNGYHVGYTGKGWAPGIAKHEDGSARDLIGNVYNDKTLNPPTACISSNDYAANFRAFLDEKETDQPFFFWYGCMEPHRPYDYQSGSAIGKKDPSSIDTVPSYWPDDARIREDMLDHAFALEHFDAHICRMLDILEKTGEYDNTIVIVTADNGMPFPRIKGQAYEHSNHMPLAISWPRGVKDPGRAIDSYVNFIDFAPTFLDVAGISESDSGMSPIAGHSLTPLFNGKADSVRDSILIGKERHDVGRPNDQGYPIRGIVKDDYIYVINFEPLRWPVGNPETGYPNTDGSPTKSVILEGRNSPERHGYWEQCFGMRPAEELFNIQTDPNCIDNLANDPALSDRKASMKKELYSELTKEEDPRIIADGSVFETYPYVDEAYRNFYHRFLAGEVEVGPWLNPTDVQAP